MNCCMIHNGEEGGCVHAKDFVDWVGEDVGCAFGHCRFLGLVY